MLWRRQVPLLLLVMCLVAAGCTNAPEAIAPSEEPASSAPTSPSSMPTEDEIERPKTLTIAVAGDIHFEGVLAERLTDPATALAPATAALAAADLAIVNLETSIGSGGTPEPGKRFTFSAGPAALTALAEAGIDVASMANNHALDYGRQRLPSTLRAIRRAARSDPALTVVGIGADAQGALRPAVTVIGGVTVETYAASAADQDPTADRTGHWAASESVGGVADALDPAGLLRVVRGSTADVVVVYLHWGIQGEQCPSRDQRTLATRLTRAGADVIVGSHAHQLQGDGRLGEAYVAYGLGNYAWYSPGDTGVLTMTVRLPREGDNRARVKNARWQPAAIGTNGLPTPMAGSAAEDFEDNRTTLRQCSGLMR